MQYVGTWWDNDIGGWHVMWKEDGREGSKLVFSPHDVATLVARIKANKQVDKKL